LRQDAVRIALTPRAKLTPLLIETFKRPLGGLPLRWRGRMVRRIPEIDVDSEPRFTKKLRLPELCLLSTGKARLFAIRCSSWLSAPSLPRPDHRRQESPSVA